MKKLYGLLLLFLVVDWSWGAVADTVFVYEEVIVYDTVRIYDTVLVERPCPQLLEIPGPVLLRIDTFNVNSKILLNYGRFVATIPVQRIIYNENIINDDSMKKLNVMAIFWLAFQTIVLAQTQFEVAVGGGISYESGVMKNIQRPYSPTANVGFFVRNDFFRHHLGIKTGIAYHRLFHTDDYTNKKVIGETSPIILRTYNEVYGRGYNYLTVPLLFYFSRFSIQPFVGINYNLFLSDLIDKTSSGSSNNIGLNVGLEWRISERFALNAMYLYNFTADGVFQLSDGDKSNSLMHKLHNQQAALSLIYRFH